MSSNFSIVIFGSGSIGKRHYQVANSIPNCNVFIRSRINLRNIELAKDGFKIFDFSRKCDLGIIASEANNHRNDYCKNYSFARKWIIEKPIVSIYDEFEDELFDIFKLKETIVGYNKRFELGIQELRKILKNKKVNSAHFKCFSNLSNWRDQSLIDSLSLDEKRGGGVINELSHEIDLANYLIGPIKKIKGITKQRKFKNYLVEDTAFLKVEHQNGINSQVDLSFGCRDEIRKTILMFDDMKIIYNHITGYLEKIPKDKKKLVIKECFRENRNKSFERQIRLQLFNDNIHTVPCSASEGLSYIKLANHLVWQ